MTTALKWVAADFGGPEVLQEIEGELSAPGYGQVTIEVRAAGMNPADYKHIAPGQDRRLLPLSIGFEVAGVVTAIGPDTQLASGGGAIGDEVLAGMTVALDTVGSDEAVDVSLALIKNRQRIVTLTAFGRAKAEGFKAIGASNPRGGPFRAGARTAIIRLAAEGKLAVPIARRSPFSQAREALTVLRGPHPAGKLALVASG
jgi:NADPH:quinone reductase-like Zn-dependent oxidoreductase